MVSWMSALPAKKLIRMISAAMAIVLTRVSVP